MVETADFKKVFDSMQQALALCIPLYSSDGSLADIRLEYFNSYFSKFFGTVLHEGDLITVKEEMLFSEIEWLKLFEKCIENNQTVERSFYSFIAKTHIHIEFNCIDKNRILVTVSDVSRIVEAEQQLRRQNERLGALTEELCISRTDLQKKFSNMQVLNEQLQFSAYYDSLTTLLNRASLTKCLRRTMEEAKEKSTKFGLLFFDIDNLKNVNDFNGHKAGDEIIIKISMILKSIETNSITCFRFASDEFYVLIRHIRTETPVINLGKELIRKANNLGVGISAGIVVYPDDAQTEDELLRYTDLTLSKAKTQGGNHICVFEQSIKEQFVSRVKIGMKLTKALNEKLFQLYYQPQFDVETGKLRGFEALLRWYDDDLGWISPGKFIPLAEETRLVVPIGDWVFDTALVTLAYWERKRLFDGILSINVSPLQFKEVDFVKKLQEKIQRTKINPNHLELEISENIMEDDFDIVVSKFNEIRELGVSVSLDDFGTGYSSISYLKNLPVSTLKIGRAFIKNLSDTDTKDVEIVKNMISLVEYIGLEAIAEGVETQKQLDVLKSFKFKNMRMQGFLKGKPMPKYACDKYLGGDESAILTNVNDN